MRISLLLTTFVCLSFMAFMGCNNGGLKGLVPVEGTVTYNGEPVAGANIRFAPEQKSETSRSAHATTDASGHFVLMTLKPNDGVAPGNYKVSIEKYSEPPRPEMAEGMTEKEKEKVAFENSAMKDQVESLLPVKYAAAASSGLVATVPKEGVKDLTFDLTD